MMIDYLQNMCYFATVYTQYIENNAYLTLHIPVEKKGWQHEIEHSEGGEGGDANLLHDEGSNHNSTDNKCCGPEAAHMSALY